MNYPFQTRDQSIELFRYEAKYTNKFSGEMESLGFTVREDADKAVKRLGVDGQGTVTELDVSAVAWMEGLEVASFDEAVSIYEQGEDAYRAKLTDAAQKSPEQLRADVDFISAMTGVELV